MNTRSRVVFLALAGFGPLGLSSLSATARIVCNGDDDYRHVHEDCSCRPEFRLTIHPDTWRRKEGEHFV